MSALAAIEPFRSGARSTRRGKSADLRKQRAVCAIIALAGLFVDRRREFAEAQQAELGRVLILSAYDAAISEQRLVSSSGPRRQRMAAAREMAKLLDGRRWVEAFPRVPRADA